MSKPPFCPSSPAVLHPDELLPRARNKWREREREREREMVLSLRGERKWGLLVINSTLIFLGAAAPLLLRLYFLKGGELLWLSSLVQVGGWPFLLIPSIISFFHGGTATPTFSLAAASAGIGVLTGLDSYMYSLSSSLLPVTINSILSSTQLAFVAVFSFLIVRQKLTSYSVNAIVVLTLGAVVLGDRPAGETKNKYGVGMAMSIGSAALYALTLPLIELVYRRVKGQVTYALVVKIQLVVSSFASAVCLVGMLLNGDLEVFFLSPSLFICLPISYSFL